MSREAELYKDKIEVSLDGRQIFYLFFGGAVIVGLVFVLGVMVGRRVEARGHTDRARVAATIDPLAALDRLEGGAGLSFQGALRGAEGPISDVEKTIAAMPKRDDKPTAKLDKKGEEPAVVAPKVEELAKNVEEPAKKVEEPVKKVEEPVKKVEEPKQADPVVTPDKPADKPAEKKQKYTLQLSSFQDKAEAEAYFEVIKHVGYNVHITEATVDGKQFYRVRTGSFRSIELATSAKAEIERSTKKAAIVVKL